MRPVIETIKSDKLINENFETLRDTLCGNISLDNMSLRILEGITQDSDTQNLVVHSGSSRPVGWLPLVGDVYVQEINEKQIDIRSTKPQVSYKIAVLFGPALTSASLKAIGGPDYQTTNEASTTQAIEQIQYIEEVNLQFKPSAIEMYTSQVLHSGTTIGSEYNSVITDGTYFYITQSNTLGSINRHVFRINRTTGVCDSLNLAGTSSVVGLYLASDGYLYAHRNRLDLETSVYKIDRTTFTVTTSYFPAVGSSSACKTLYVDDTNIYISGSNVGNTLAKLFKVPKDGSPASALTLSTGTNAFAYSVLPLGTDLWIIVDDTAKPSVSVVRVDKNTFTITSTTTGTEAFEARAAVLVGTYIIAPVRYSSSHAASGGLVTYYAGGIGFNTVDSTVTFIPLGNVPSIMFQNCVASEGYVYLAGINASYPMGTNIIRYDTLTNDYISAWIPLQSTSYGSNGLNSLLVVDTDGDVLYIRNTTSSDPVNFEFAKVDFTDYDI